MSRVLHVAQPTQAGVARVVADLVRNQLEGGWDVTVACPPGGELAAVAGQAGARMVPWPATRDVGPAVAAEAGRLSRLLAREVPEPHLVHLHSAKAGLVGRLVLRGRRPTVYQPHAWSFQAATGATRAAALAWERHAARWAHRIVCGSEREREHGVAAGVPDRCVVLPNGVDVDRFIPQDESERRRARIALGLAPPSLGGASADRVAPDRAPVVVCLGRLCRQKGQDVLLAAWPRIAALVPGARLVLVGDGPARAALAASAPSGVDFAGPATDPRPWYAAADVIVLPSRWEGAPLVPLEALASGRCVVATDAGGVREALPAGSSAVVPVEDPAALADAVAHRLRRPEVAAAEAAAGRARVCAEYDLRRTAARLRGLYQEVMARGP